MIELLNRTVLTCALSLSFFSLFWSNSQQNLPYYRHSFYLTLTPNPFALIFNFVDSMFSLELATEESATVVINFQCSAGEGVVSFCSS